MSKSNDGTALQDKVQAALKAFCETRKAFFYRFPDTKAARGRYLPAQPGDFMLLLPGRAILIECKSTEVSAPLKKLLDPGQCGKHRLWWRSGHPSAFVYGDLQRNWVEWHDGRAVVERKQYEPTWAGNDNNCEGMLTFIALE